jgi:hypothetical protein
MPGTHTPEHVKRTTEGYAWFIEYDDHNTPRFERFRSGNILFKRVDRQLHSQTDIESLRQALDLPEKAITVLEIRLGGRLTSEELKEIVSLHDVLKTEYLDVSLTSDIVKRIDAGMISAEFPDGTYPHRLLNELSEHPEDSQALQLAYDIIKSLQP